MGKDTGFKEFDRKTPSYKSVAERTKSYSEFIVPLPVEEVQTQGARCMNCGVPFCHTGCPLGNIIPDFNDHVYRGKWGKALESLLATNNFPEFTGRICPAPCESACVLGINKPPVAIKSIEVSIIDQAFQNGLIKGIPPKIRTGKRVAVVGSGPSGLAAADQLNQAGHSVTVYERAEKIGGLLRYGIPDFKLGKDVVERRVNVMRDSGVVFKTSAHVGVNVPVSELEQNYDAVVLACGATVPRDLPIPGRAGEGVYPAMEFLSQNNHRVAGLPGLKNHRGQDIGEILAKGKNVLVIGGGDTGSDCVGTSIRQGAKSVLQIELLPKPAEGRTAETPWPTHPGPKMLSTSSSQAEGCQRDWSVGSKEFIRDAKGNLTGVKAMRLDWSTGKPAEVPGSEFEIKAELVLLAMGFLYTDPTGLLEELGVEKDERGNVKASPVKYETSVPKVFAAGDMRRGQSLVVWAISEGRECARQVDAFLRKGVSVLNAKDATGLKI
ncbi:MAG: glutamate synthase subunit beta, partial [Spirochaetia bacterium]|nr:glutamate synthase subunit beta [Spirochaetia bacterium]